MPNTEEWNPWITNSRDLETMQRIALEAVEFADDDGAFRRYASEHNLTVNDVVYYLNAYEYGGVAGLEAIRNPDIIPPDVARGAIEAIGAALDAHFTWPMAYRLTDEGTGIGVYQVQERMNGDRYLFPVCQFRLTLKGKMWHLYWMRKFDAWWPYPPSGGRHRYTLKARIEQLLEDEDGCFWG